jgi:hypothetical protein
MAEKTVFQVPFGDHKIDFMQPTEAQAVMLARFAGVAERNPGSAVFAIARIFDVIDALVVKAADRAWLEDELIAGRVEIGEFIAVLDMIKQEATAASEPKKAVRGRPRSAR